MNLIRRQVTKNDIFVDWIYLKAEMENRRKKNICTFTSKVVKIVAKS